MDKELEQEAIQTFAAVPEIYQQAFKNAGADFPDELVTEIKKDPNQAVNLLNSDKNLKNAVINIYKSNKDAIVKYVQQAKSMFKNGGKFDYLKKLQEGGRLKRRDMFNQANTNRGFSRSDTRRAYNNARNAGLNRQAAMRAVVGSKPQLARVELNDPQIDIIPAEVDSHIGLEPIEYVPEFEAPKIDYNTLSFKDAFRLNRQAGNKDFMWKGKRYTTELADDVVPTETEVKPIVKVFQRGMEPIVEDIRWNNEHRPYWADLKKKGGKLAKENEVNKKYINDSEKAGQEASRKMTDLKNKHKAELKKVRKGQDGLKTYIQRKYDEAIGPISRGWNNFKQSAPGQVMIGLLPVQTNTITTDENGNQMYAASPMFGGPGKSGRMLDADIDKLYINMNNSTKGLFKDLEKVIPGEASQYRIPKGNVFNFSTPDYSKILEGAVFTKPTLRGRILNFVDKLKKK